MKHSQKKNPYDIIVIGAGIIGASASLSSARKGYSVLCLDAGPGAGYGSTSGSCAIIRPYYSTIDGSAIAYESHYYWKNWTQHIGVSDEHGLARYVNCGSLVMKTPQNDFLEPACLIMDEIGAPYSHLSADEVCTRLPVNTEAFAPAKNADDPQFGLGNGEHLPGGVMFHSGGYITDPQLATHNIQRAAEAAGAEMVTVAVRRVNLTDKDKPLLVDYLDPEKYIYLPNTAGCFTAEDAIRTLRLAREAGGWNLVKLEVLSDQKTLYPDMEETLRAAKLLIADGFEVMVYCSDDPVYARKLEDAGCCAIMPLGSLIGSGLGIINPVNIRLIVEQSSVPVIVDAGVGTASDAAVAMELGCDGVLMNTAIAEAKDPTLMASAMKHAVIAGREAYLAGRMAKKRYADPSSPLAGLI